VHRRDVELGERVRPPEVVLGERVGREAVSEEPARAEPRR